MKVRFGKKEYKDNRYEAEKKQPEAFHRLESRERDREREIMRI